MDFMAGVQQGRNEMRAEVERLKAENAKLRARNDDWASTAAEGLKEADSLRSSLAAVEAERDSARRTYDEQQHELHALKARAEAAEARVAGLLTNESEYQAIQREDARRIAALEKHNEVLRGVLGRIKIPHNPTGGCKETCTRCAIDAALTPIPSKEEP